MSQLPDRVFLTVLDSVGVGELPDAAAYGDEGSDTLGNISREIRLKLPTLRSLGLPRVANIYGMAQVDAPIGAFGRMAERSPGNAACQRPCAAAAALNASSRSRPSASGMRTSTSPV